MAEFPIPEGHYLLGGRSKANARQALAEAEENGYGPESVLTRADGYAIPLPVDFDGYVADSTDGEPVNIEGAPVGDEAPRPDDSWKNADIEKWAEDNGVDLNGATVKADMLAAIQTAADSKEEN